MRKSDVTVAKNYLNQGEISELNRIVVMFLDYAEDQARRRKQVFLKDGQVKLDEFLRLTNAACCPMLGRYRAKLRTNRLNSNMSGLANEGARKLNRAPSKTLSESWRI